MPMYTFVNGGSVTREVARPPLVITLGRDSMSEIRPLAKYDRASCNQG